MATDAALAFTAAPTLPDEERRDEKSAQDEEDFDREDRDRFRCWPIRRIEHEIMRDRDAERRRASHQIKRGNPFDPG